MTWDDKLSNQKPNHANRPTPIIVTENQFLYTLYTWCTTFFLYLTFLELAEDKFSEEECVDFLASASLASKPLQKVNVVSKK